MAREFFSQTGPFQEPFASHIPLIAWELGIDEPVFAEDVEALWHRVVDAPHWSNKGPLVKLMRWLSFFQCAQYYKGDLIASRMVLLKQGDVEHVFSDDEETQKLLPVKQTQQEKEKTLKEELRALKKHKGTFNLAPRLLTPKFIQQKDIVCIVSQASCKHHSEEAKELLTAHQVKAHIVASVTGNGWAQELAPRLLFSTYVFVPALGTPHFLFSAPNALHPLHFPLAW